MKKIVVLLLAAAALAGHARAASAIDFRMKGDWMFGFGLVDTNYVKKVGGNNVKTTDDFAALQRVRLQMDAVASEALSGTLYFEIGDTPWGRADRGGALGADGNNVIKVKRAYLDWLVPNTDLKLRMGLQGVTLPNAAGGSTFWDDDAAAITASYAFNEHVGLTAMWARPYNDNYAGERRPDGSMRNVNFLDNVDMFMLSVPLTFEGFKLTPWAMYGMIGKNTVTGGASFTYYDYGTRPFVMAINDPAINANTGNAIFNANMNKAYVSAVYAGLPVIIDAFEPLRIEVDLNYAYVESRGRFDVRNQADGQIRRGDSRREGWLAKALVEYKLDWGTPGIFGWYGSGDDDNVKNGSERMPSFSPAGYFTSFIGDGFGWGTHAGRAYDQSLHYGGTWGIGAQIKDVSFLEDLKHTLRVTYWGGTNSTKMTDYLGMTDATTTVGVSPAGFYLTTADHLVEINLDSVYQIYENLDARLELGYIINGIDKGTWNRSFHHSSYSKSDGYKAGLIFTYKF